MPYLYWEQCLVRIDQAAAQLRMHSFEERNAMYPHWSPKQMDFHYVTKHPSGKKITLVYVLSRHIAIVITSLLV
jgi:hypothetical protein